MLLLRLWLSRTAAAKETTVVVFLENNLPGGFFTGISCTFICISSSLAWSHPQ
jgi:hypothetical protein